MAWATIDDVATITGLPRTGAEAPTASEVAVAQGIVELRAGIFADNTGTPTSVRDAQLLQRAVAYQVPWLRAHPDVFERMDVTSHSSDGQSANLGDGALFLAPLAKLAISRLSWKRARSTKTSSTETGSRRVFDSEGDIAPGFWTPLV